MGLKALCFLHSILVLLKYAILYALIIPRSEVTNMISELSFKIKNRLIHFFSKSITQHLAFWLLFLFILTAIESTSHNILFAISNEVINVIFYVILVYFNLFYLIPNYLTQKKFLTYAVLLILSAIILTPLKVIVFYFKFSHLPDVRNQLVDNMNWYFLVNFFIAGTSTIVKIITDWGKQLREKHELQTQTMQSELRFLKSQINPHFLFNTLNNLYALTLKKDDKAPEIVIKLSEMMRYMLYECNEKQVLLSKEINYIKNYLDLEKLRQGKSVSISFEHSGDPGNKQIAPLMFIPFLENSFKHGLSHQIEQGFVKIRLDVQDDEVDFFIENSKPEKLPTPLTKGKKSGGIGLVNVQRRLNLLYPDQYDLKIHDYPKSYAVNLKIRLN